MRSMHQDYPIRSLNSWRTGGQVKLYSEPSSLAALIQLYQQHQDERTIWLGLGSNMLFADGVLDAHMIRTTKALSDVQVVGGKIEVAAGVTLAKLAKVGAKHGFKEAAFFATIPGTVGGALMMNAGAYGFEMWDFVDSVQVLTPKGVKWLSRSECVPGYRHVLLPKGEEVVLFLSAVLCFEQGGVVEAKQQIKSYLAHRNQTQPIGTYNCGSVFRNPEGNSAGRMIDQMGLLGYQRGYARVSPKHGNFIENVEMRASYEDICGLIEYLKQRVYGEYGQRLVLEVKVYE